MKLHVKHAKDGTVYLEWIREDIKTGCREMIATTKMTEAEWKEFSLANIIEFETNV